MLKFKEKNKIKPFLISNKMSESQNETQWYIINKLKRFYLNCIRIFFHSRARIVYKKLSKISIDENKVFSNMIHSFDLIIFVY